jgi:hypothetical protein
MKVSQIGIIAIMLVVIAVALSGCTSQTTTTQSGSFGQATPAASGAATGGSGAASGGSGAASSSGSSGPVSAASVFGNLGYEWVEYKMAAGEGAEKMTIYYKYNHKTGKCTMRFEGAAAVQGMPSEMDCSAGAAGGSSGKSAGGNPNDVSPDVKLVKVGTETVTVGAGTFVADKYTATSKDMTATYWIANGKPLLKMEGSSTGQGGNVVMELNGWG